MGVEVDIRSGRGDGRNNCLYSNLVLLKPWLAQEGYRFKKWTSLELLPPGIDDGAQVSVFVHFYFF